MPEKNVAIVLAGGSGKRMNSDIHKQFLLLQGRPLIFYALNAFEKSSIDEIILVSATGEQEYCQQNIVDRYHFTKVKKVVPGGQERYHSVAAGLNSIESCDYVYIHDGARPFLREEVINRAMENVRKYKACITGVPVYDTIKRTDSNGVVTQTIPRENLWSVQTPQCFSYEIIKKAYDKLLVKEKTLEKEGIKITDDAMVLETFSDIKVNVIMGDYNNRKVTTQEDLLIMEQIMK